ncbi:MAG TPA: cyclic nucleotide-binding domain-containing protein [Candidatus Marinimicrobia bacterium]|nr:cyclic nucleotide-binding domain-containing protein [Candidatus Neomarinimicrobiota bacterium]
MDEVDLMQFKFFQSISETDRERIASLMEPLHLKKGETLFLEGESGRDLYFVLEGRVDILIRMVEKTLHENKVSTIKSGEIIGELSFLDGQKRSASSLIRNDALLYKLPYNKAIEYFDSHPEVGYVFMREIANSLADRLRTVNLMWRNSIPYAL